MFLSASKKQARSKWKTHRNVKKWWLYFGNLLEYLYHQKYYELISVDLSRKTNTSIPPQNNFVWKLEKNDGATILFVSEMQQKIILNFSLDSLIVTESYNNGTSKNIKLFEWSKQF